MRRLASSFSTWGLLVVGGFLLLSAGAYAQQWESAYGDSLKEETARNGVRPVTEGGYVSVGDTKSLLLNQNDIYVVRTDNHGVLAWARSYDIGPDDAGTDIEEVRDAQGATDGFIITGYTNHRSGSPCGTTYNVFLLRIDRCGNVVWQRTYGEIDFDEYGWDVVEATRGAPLLGTNTGDFIVAGWQGNTPNRNGYLLRVTSAGVPVWGTLYRGPQNNRDDYFYSLDEATTTGAGEIIAAGGTSSYRLVTSLDGWLVRVNGNTGVVVIATAHGSPVSTEEFRSVQELNTGSNAGDIVTIGQTTTAGGVNRDVYLLETTSALNFVANLMLGFNDYDEGFYVREISAAAGNIPSNIITTGYLIPPKNWGHGGEEVFLQEFVTGTTLASVGNTLVFGEEYNDRGWSVEPVAAASPCVIAGFIMAGSIEKPFHNPTDPRQLYMIKTNGKVTTCEMSFAPPTKIPNFDRIALNPLTATLKIDCVPPIGATILTREQPVCRVQGHGTIQCLIPDCAPPPPAPGADPDQNLSERSIDIMDKALSR
jgi:hypothetical protein